jgi:hypothetical protein
MTDTYQGKPCAQGHDGTRYASNRKCVACASVDWRSRYRIAHAAGQDAGNRSAKARGLASWDEQAWDDAAEAFRVVWRSVDERA